MKLIIFNIHQLMRIPNFANIFWHGNYRDERHWFFFPLTFIHFNCQKSGLDWKSPSWNEKNTWVLTPLHFGLKKYGKAMVMFFCWLNIVEHKNITFSKNSFQNYGHRMIRYRKLDKQSFCVTTNHQIVIFALWYIKKYDKWCNNIYLMIQFRFRFFHI